MHPKVHTRNPIDTLNPSNPKPKTPNPFRMRGWCKNLLWNMKQKAKNYEDISHNDLESVLRECFGLGSTDRVLCVDARPLGEDLPGRD